MVTCPACCVENKGGKWRWKRGYGPLQRSMCKVMATRTSKEQWEWLDAARFRILTPLRC